MRSDYAPTFRNEYGTHDSVERRRCGCSALCSMCYEPIQIKEEGKRKARGSENGVLCVL